MLTPTLESLLKLQERDQKRVGLEANLKVMPREVALVEQEIAGEKGAIENARTELKEIETRRKLLETEIGGAEQQLAKYRTQQLAIKKNDEYQALGHQIDATQAQIGELEGRELEAMYAADEARKRFAAAEGVLKQNIAGHEGRIRMLRGREAEVAAALKGAQAEVAQARDGVPAPALKIYDRVAGRGLPAVVPIREGKCGGCHLKVSSEVESTARGKTPGQELGLCDQCGRVVYWEG